MKTEARNCFGDSRANLTPILRTKSRTQLASSSSSSSSSSTDREIASFDDTSTDPFVILGLDAPTADGKVIKRAYKRRALKFHPDVVTTQESTAAEKKAASDRFAKINWAYQTLSGKREANDKTYGGSTATTGTSTSSTGGWSPPHRRSGGYTTSSDSSWPGSTDWRDFMPKYEDDKEYDAGGDSFGKIFSDLFAGAAYGAAGVAESSAGLLMDFIEFLEGNVDGYGADSGASRGGFGSRGSDDYDVELQVLLRTGSLEDVANEMDDTNLVVEQLQSKARSIDDEILTVNAETKMESRYMEKIELEEQVAELKARKGVIDGYLKKSRKRLLSLQTRYKELISYGGANDSYAGGGRRSSSSSSSTSGGSSTTSERTGTTSSSPYDSSTRSTNDTGNQNDSWKTEGFGSSSSPRGSRGSARRRARRSSSTTDAGTTQSSSSSTGTATPSSPASPPPRSESPYSSSSSASYGRESVRPTSNPSTSTAINSTGNSSDSSVPPHRRTSSNYTSSAEENMRRMREIKVDEEFEKLKKDLGL
ncbi:DnaJ domain containing protein [Nitzschia inconspicua]|uniref:DnaJ domain containing protein n=1 Tax=Nitzschia inconspicua TaxID=303405 RepID=A0A9K3PDY1_9STRA|nr:DnaJ domain containing protein [Nitzschia inconspicua]